MVNRVLLIAFIAISTGGEASAIAREPVRTVSEQPALTSETLISQASGSDSDASAPSPAIQALQNRLTELGYYEGPIDGVFSQETRGALASFQQEQGLVGTGILDPLTQQRLSNPDAPPPDEAEAPAESDDAEAESPFSDLPPVSEGGEVDVPGVGGEAEADSASEEAEAATGDEPESSTDPEAATAEAPSGDPDSAPDGAGDESAATTESRGIGRLLILGVLLLILGAMATGILLWLSKKRRQPDSLISEDETDAEDPSSVAAQDAEIADLVSSVRCSSSQPPPPPRAQTATHNGQQTPASSTPTTSLDVHHQSLAINNPTEARVARVNIIDELIQDLQKPDTDIRHKAIWELGQRGNSAAVQPLVNLLAEADSQEQSLVLAALAEISSQTLKPMNRAVAIALQNENAEVRKNAIRDLARIYDSLNQAGRMLGHASMDEDADVRQTANWALDQLNKTRLSATDTASLLQDSKARDQLTDDGSSAHPAN
ncbi:MAG: peptidoglycan-binding protein [Leptolyngbyaceae cyanobacterium]